MGSPCAVGTAGTSWHPELLPVWMPLPASCSPPSWHGCPHGAGAVSRTGGRGGGSSVVCGSHPPDPALLPLQPPRCTTWLTVVSASLAPLHLLLPRGQSLELRGWRRCWHLGRHGERKEPPWLCQGRAGRAGDRETGREGGLEGSFWDGGGGRAAGEGSSRVRKPGWE